MFTQYYEEFAKSLDVSDPTFRTSLQDLWLAFLRTRQPPATSPGVPGDATWRPSCGTSQRLASSLARSIAAAWLCKARPSGGTGMWLRMVRFV